MSTQVDGKDAPMGEGATGSYPWARAFFRLEERVDRMGPVVAAVPLIQDHLSRQDAAIEKLNTKVDDRLAGIHQKMDAGFGELRDTLAGMATPFGHARTLLERDLASRRRKIAVMAWVDRSVDKLQYALGVLWMGISVFAFTHPVGGRPDPDVMPGWAAVTALGVAVVARNAYVSLHREQGDPDAPDDPDGEERPAEHQHHHQQPPEHHQTGQR